MLLWSIAILAAGILIAACLIGAGTKPAQPRRPKDDTVDYFLWFDE